jgi:dTDP-4-amino-4,6-dideoxygalactose transaminase
LLEQGVHTGIHYPVPIHLQEAYRFMGLKTGSYPGAEMCAKKMVSLPMFPELTEAQIDHVVAVIKEWISKVPL